MSTYTPMSLSSLPVDRSPVPSSHLISKKTNFSLLNLSSSSSSSSLTGTMESDKPLAQVQLKSDFTKTYMVPSLGPQGPLAPSSLRVQTAVLALSVNNQSYAIWGSTLGWWDVFPVTTANLPAPYDDKSQYGILGGWGYARVLESTVEGVRPGQLVRGFVPLSAVPVDLQLRPAAAVAGHYVEVSPHRAGVMALYQRYVVQDDDLSLNSQTDLDKMAREAVLGPVWECSHLLSRFTFATENETLMNPAGDDLPWTREQADIGAATVICLAASSKTSMSLAWELNHRVGPDSGPFAVVGVTSPANVEFVRGTGLYSAVLTYDEARANGARALVANLNINTKRIVMLDFGARGTFTADVVTALRAGGPSHLPPLMAVRVGIQNKPYSPDELRSKFKNDARLDLVRTNTSPLRDQALRTLGEQRYFSELDAARKSFFDGGGASGLQISWARGMTGAEGLEGAWEALCNGRTDPRQGIVVRL